MTDEPTPPGCQPQDCCGDPAAHPPKTKLDEIKEYMLTHPIEPKRKDGYSSPSLDFRPETFRLRMQRALELNHPIDPYKLVFYNDVPMRLMDLPTPELKALSGYGHFTGDIRRREIVPWPLSEGGWNYKPETCPVADGHRGVWVDAGHLACPGCGMDFT